MLSRKTQLTIMKIISMFSVVRGYNIPIIVVAQYLSAIFILAPEKRALSVLLDHNVFIIVLASALTIASGYIINNFYDSKKDLINRPNKSKIDRLVSQKTKLQVYFTINFIVAIIAFIISFRALLFFSVYIFLIWFYSHKLKRYPIIGNLTAALLAILPFFAILLYYYFRLPFEEIINFQEILGKIFSHATFLFLLLLIREIIKDLENIKGDIANDYKTIPVKYGESFAKKVITTLTLCTLVPVYFLVDVYDVAYMDIYFYISLMVLLLFVLLLWRAQTKKHYLVLHNILKTLIVSGVFCIVLINPEVLIHARAYLKI